MNVSIDARRSILFSAGMSNIAPPYLPRCPKIGHLSAIPVVARQRRKAMSTHEHPIATARDVLFAYAMMGSAVASLAIIAAPHLEMLLRCIFYGRG
jgi:hypothetical protein